MVGIGVVSKLVEGLRWVVLGVVRVEGVVMHGLGQCEPSRGMPLWSAGYDPSQRIEGDRTLVKPIR